MTISPQRRQEIIDALRRGTVPKSSLDAFAVGLERFETALDEDLEKVATGGSVLKLCAANMVVVRLFSRDGLSSARKSLALQLLKYKSAKQKHHCIAWRTVYRRLNERLATADTVQGALRNIVDGWFYTLEEDVLAEEKIGAKQRRSQFNRSHWRVVGTEAGKGKRDARCLVPRCGAIDLHRVIAIRPLLMGYGMAVWPTKRIRQC